MDTPLIWRVVIGIVANGLLAISGWRLGAFDVSGALVGSALGLAVFIGGDWHAYLLLGAFVVLGSLFTRFGYNVKKGEGTAEARGGRRSWREAGANLAVGAICALGYLATGREPWLWALVGAFAAALADTTESELGTLVARTAYVPGSFRRVPAGTEGAVSPAGTLLGLAASLAVVCLAVVVDLVPAVAIVPVAVAALLATVLESLLGTARPLSNELLNTVTTATGAGLAVIAVRLAGSVSF